MTRPRVDINIVKNRRGYTDNVLTFKSRHRWLRFNVEANSLSYVGGTETAHERVARARIRFLSPIGCIKNLSFNFAY